jgi:medium-chain acyl-[acyl-carrier-protein] hydrolase
MQNNNSDPKFSVYEEIIRIPGYECDFNQKLKPAAFFRYLTEAAGVHAEQLGAGFQAMQNHNLFWVHSRMKIKFFKFPRIGERITLKTWPKTIQQKLFFIRDYEVFNETGEKIAAASSAWLLIDSVTRRMVPSLSAGIQLPSNPDLVGLNEPLERLGLAQNGEKRLDRTASYSSLDLLNHVNNSRYVEWICDALPADLINQNEMDWMQINYDHETRAGEEVSVFLNQVLSDPTLWALEGINQSDGQRSFEALVCWKKS